MIFEGNFSDEVLNNVLDKLGSDAARFKEMIL